MRPPLSAGIKWCRLTHSNDDVLHNTVVKMAQKFGSIADSMTTKHPSNVDEIVKRHEVEALDSTYKRIDELKESIFSLK